MPEGELTEAVLGVQNGGTVLVLASQYGHVAVVHALLLHGAKVDKPMQVTRFPASHLPALGEMPTLLKKMRALLLPP